MTRACWAATGLWALRSVRGGWDHVCASGFDDSGFYVGTCRDCEATISHALAERNAYGFAGSNSGGHLAIEKSLFRNNTIGLTTNSTLSDPTPPQLGTCNAAANRLATPTIASTAVARSRSSGTTGSSRTTIRPRRPPPLALGLMPGISGINGISGSA